MFDYHVFVCINERDQPKQGCRDRQDKDLLVELKDFVKRNKLSSKVRINKSGCLGHCKMGPTIVVYPQNIWFFQVDEQKLEEIYALLTS